METPSMWRRHQCLGLLHSRSCSLHPGNTLASPTGLTWEPRFPHSVAKVAGGGGGASTPRGQLCHPHSGCVIEPAGSLPTCRLWHQHPQSVTQPCCRDYTLCLGTPMSAQKKLQHQASVTPQNPLQYRPHPQAVPSPMAEVGRATPLAAVKRTSYEGSFSPTLKLLLEQTCHLMSSHKAGKERAAPLNHSFLQYKCEMYLILKSRLTLTLTQLRPLISYNWNH